jgi:UDP-3-O-[3-hydroxymyristoyl] glucosamine N-acyltransferase
MADVPAGADVLGSPALPIREFFRQVLALRRLAAGRRPGPGGSEQGGSEGAGATPAATKASD